MERKTVPISVDQKKTRQGRNAITTLNVNNKIVTGPREIDNEVFKFYQSLYS